MKTDKGSPRPWYVLEIMNQPFVAASNYKGHPYFNGTRYVEILSDEEYPKKREDCELIVHAVNTLPVAVKALRIISELTSIHGAVSDAAVALAKRALEVVDPK